MGAGVHHCQRRLSDGPLTREAPHGNAMHPPGSAAAPRPGRAGQRRVPPDEGRGAFPGHRGGAGGALRRAADVRARAEPGAGPCAHRA